MLELTEDQIKKKLCITKPVLLLDAVKISDSEILGKCYVNEEYSFWNCHFVGNPVMPGTYMLEMLAQSAALLEMFVTNSNVIPIIVSISKVRFLRKITLNSIIMSDVMINCVNDSFYTTQGKILCDEKVVCKAEMVHLVKN